MQNCASVALDMNWLVITDTRVLHVEFPTFEDFFFQSESGTNSNDSYFMGNGGRKTGLVKVHAL